MGMILSNDIGVCSIQEFSYENFSYLLKIYRKQREISQYDLSTSLSISHDIFKNVTQSMISLWENGKCLPSLTRRVGIATFFNVGYHYATFEVALLKRSLKNEFFYDPHLTIYPIVITHVENVRWLDVTGNMREQIQHAFSVRHRGNLDVFLKDRELLDVKVRCYFYGDMLVGHVLYNIKDDIFHYICAAGINADIHAKVLFDMKDLCTAKTIYMPATIPAIKYFLMSIYGTKVGGNDTTIIYAFDKCDFFSNPYVKALFIKKQEFILLCYQVHIDGL